MELDTVAGEEWNFPYFFDIQKCPLRSILLYEVYFVLKKYFWGALRSIFKRWVAFVTAIFTTHPAHIQRHPSRIRSLVWLTFKIGWKRRYNLFWKYGSTDFKNKQELKPPNWCILLQIYPVRSLSLWTQVWLISDLKPYLLLHGHWTFIVPPSRRKYLNKIGVEIISIENVGSNSSDLKLILPKWLKASNAFPENYGWLPVKTLILNVFMFLHVL